MKKLLVALVLALSLSGCALWRVASTPEAFTACTVADTATTIYAVHSGLAVEANPLLAGAVNAHSFLPLILTKLAVVGLIYWLVDTWLEETKHGVGAATTITCGVAAGNSLIILKGRIP